MLDSPRSLRKISVSSVDATSSDDDESDVSSLYSSSLLSTARRNWDFTGSIKDVRPVAPRRRSNSISPSKSGPNSIAQHNDPANDPLESVRRKAEKAFKVLSKRNAHASSKTPQSASTSGIKWCENNVIWSSLSSTLVKHGKEAVKQRDMALQAVLDGLLEASASEKLVKCLSKYSELQADKDDDPKEIIDRFLRFSQDLDHAIFIAQSQTRLRQGKACCSNSTSSTTTKAATKAALDRKQSAISWIRAAIEADLSSSLGHTRVASESAKASVVEAKPASPLFCSKPKCNCNSRPLKKTADASTEGSNLNAAMFLAITMRSDCNRWFLKYIEKFLDDIENKTNYTTCDSQIAGFLQQLKKVDDWLNRVVRHERMFTTDRSNKDSALSEEEESDACERVCI
ncbi:hypothetical protein QOZ80_7BG0606440 [Eleusine coracana subsp. coracana]|nr:hypothetical protein QOZ80_7BG0606440 [Eleusine coracana subsp. coracana]